MNDVIFGDCLEELVNIDDNSVDMILTDPPYFLPVNSYVGVRGKDYERKRTLADTSILKTYFKQIFKEFSRVTKDTGVWYVFCDGQSYPIFYECAFPYCSHVRPLIWDKIVSYNGYTWRHQHEIILWGELENTPRIETGDGDIIKCRGVLQKDRNHPAEKPVELLRKLIEKHNECGIILDPFAGSGSTVIASIQLKRKYIAMELNEDNIEKIHERIKKIDNMNLEHYLE